jgi:putative salt-induced outer membrane protein YdiY
MTRSQTLAVCCLLTPLLHAVSTPAAEIHLKDGSVVVGTIEALTDGEDLTVDTKYMDDVVIDWAAIERIEETAPVNVELFSGERILGNLSLTEEGLFVEEGEVRREIEPDRVFGIDDYTESWLDGLGAYVNLGANLVRGNNRVTQVTYAGGLSYDANRFESGLDTTLIVNQQTNARDTQRYTLSTFYTHRLGGQWTAGGRLSFESDEQQELVGRSLLSGALGNRVINTRVQRLSLSGGLALNSEEFEGVPATESLEALLGVVYRLRSKWDLDFDSSLYVLPSLTESGRLRVQFDSTMSADLIGDLDFRLIYYNRYDSDPPAAVQNVDWGLTFALGYDF